MQAEPDMSVLLQRAGAGDREALDAVFPHIYGELRRLAGRQLAAEASGHTLGPTALVHEAWLRLAGEDGALAVRWQDRAHFFGIAATAMRRILVEHARRRHAVKRGAAPVRLVLDDVATLAVDDRAELLVALDDALVRLATLDTRLARVVECRFFGGLTEDETAQVLGIGTRTVKRDWSRARAWLLADLRDDASPGTGAP